MTDSTIQTALVGAGYISDLHAEVLQPLSNVTLAGLVDSNVKRARRQAAKWNAPHACTSLAELLMQTQIDAVHIASPPDTHHALAYEALLAGCHVMVEKPVAVRSADARALGDEAGAAGRLLQVNQNAIYYPAYENLAAVIDSGAIGPIVHLSCHYLMPLKQFKSGQLGHWMFREPLNLLLEQAVHPLSQILAFMGMPTDLSAAHKTMRPAGSNEEIISSWQVAMNHPRGSSNLIFAIDNDYQVWRLHAVCTDGTVDVDIINNRLSIARATRWPNFFDAWLNGVSNAKSNLAQSTGQLGHYLASTSGLKARSDPFFVTMQRSIHGFYEQIGDGDRRSNVVFAGNLVQVCEKISATAPVQAPLAETAPRQPRPTTWDVAVLGGTGFIGRHLVARLVEEGKRVAVQARQIERLPTPFDGPNVVLVQGDISNSDDVKRAIGNSKRVVQLATGGDGTSSDGIEKGMVEAVNAVAQACVDREVECLVHVGSIASLYLGHANEEITGDCQMDPRWRQRAPYARAKAAAESCILKWHRDHGLPVAILRPGVVIGPGGSRFHSALGLFHRETHCLGWNRGENGLPFVLVDDVAEAILLALNTPGQAVGQCFNLVGEIRLTAREYIAELGAATGRPLVYHSQSPAKIWLVESSKWLIKRLLRRHNAQYSALRDLQSRGLVAQFDCQDVKQALGWEPEADQAEFITRGIRFGLTCTRPHGGDNQNQKKR